MKKLIDSVLTDQTLVLDYTELGSSLSKTFLRSDLDEGELLIITTYDNLINTILNSNRVPKLLDLVKSVSLTNGNLSIVGESNTTKDFELINLSDTTLVGTTGKTQKQVYDELESAVLSATGQPFTQLFAPFGTGYVYLNNEKMVYNLIVQQTGYIMGNATKLALDLLNS
jgi:hypothetical protein